MPRLYILGLNNPESSDPRAALYPSKPTVAGWRLWKMASDACGIGSGEWLLATQRVNLLSDTVLPQGYKAAAGRRGQYLGGLVKERVVLLLGSDVAAAMRHDYPPFVWSDDRPWVLIPHPSGKNLFYNNPVHAAAAGILVADMLRLCGVWTPGTTYEALVRSGAEEPPSTETNGE